MSARIEKEICRYKLVAQPLMVREAQKLIDSKSTYDFLMSQVYDKETFDVFESFYAVFLNANNRVKGFIKVSDGGVNAAIVDPKIIFSAALKCLATAVIFTHNHPAGSIRPSEEDKKLTKKLVDGARLLDITPMDHVIVTNRGYYSFRDNGMI